jgi:hypothetical protein
MPARLLELHTNMDGQIDARIVLSEKIGLVPYLTLSYCWGGDQEFKTTEKSLLTSKGVVNVSELPQTIKDAVTVTMEMGYSYLWVDSICIMQDNDKDRTNEIARMPAIYNNAICCIAASFPTHVGQGFLDDRTTYTDRRMALKVQPTYPEGVQKAQRAFAYPIELEDALALEPLAERGWYVASMCNLPMRHTLTSHIKVHARAPPIDAYIRVPSQTSPLSVSIHRRL